MTNIVFINTHDTGRYIEPYGYNVPTPNLQSIAEEGILFRNAFCAQPTCSPSRGALMTGQAPHSNGLIGLVHRGFSIDDHSQHLVRYLSRNGFQTVLCGKQHEAEGESRECASREHLGYDRLPSDPGPVEELKGNHDDYGAARAAAEYIREDHDDPFFLSLGLFNTHRPYSTEDPNHDPDYVQPPEPIPDVPAARRDMAGFMTSAAIVDDCTGHVLDALRETGALANTLVVFTTDHGPPFPNMKCTLFDSGIGVSLIMRFPERWRGETSDALVSQIDLYPTLCDCLDLDVPAWVQGTSMLPLLRGETDAIRDAVFSEMTYHAAYEPKRSIRTDRYKYIRRFDDTYDQYILAHIDDGPTKGFLVERGLAEQTRPREALFDLAHDPNERENLVDDSAYADVHADLVQRLDEWMRETNDPLVNGPVPKPAGARINERDCVRSTNEHYEDQGIR